ncbi:hypothetical protein ACOSQ3_014501 [Xanthoceras sorbifolium]
MTMPISEFDTKSPLIRLTTLAASDSITPILTINSAAETIPLKMATGGEKEAQTRCQEKPKTAPRWSRATTPNPAKDCALSRAASVFNLNDPNAGGLQHTTLGRPPMHDYVNLRVRNQITIDKLDNTSRIRFDHTNPNY